MSLWLLRVGISAVARADVLPVDDVVGKLREVAGEETAELIDNLDLRGYRPSGQDLVDKVKDQAEVFDKAYSELTKWVDAKEDEISAATGEIREVEGGAHTAGKADRGRPGGGWCCRGTLGRSWWRFQSEKPQTTGTGQGGASGGEVPDATEAAPVSAVAQAGKRSFERDMILASRQRGTEVPEWAWVRKVNVDKWKRFQSPNPIPSTQPAPTSRCSSYGWSISMDSSGNNGSTSSSSSSSSSGSGVCST